MSDVEERGRSRHKKHHSKKHLDFMKKEMLRGKTFTESHKLAQKKVGT